MSLTWTQMKTKAQRWARNSEADVLTQLEEDMNTGYHDMNAKFARYYSRKQQFASLVANQSIYQTPIDSVRAVAVSVLVTPTYENPVEPIKSESEWRYITSYKSMSTNWPTYYFPLGNDKIQLWPTPSQSIANGLRYVYQPQDYDLSIDDTTSTSTGETVTVTNGSTTVTATGSPFNSDMKGMSFRPEGQADLTWYEIVSATTNTLQLKSPYVAPSGSGKAWRVGQLSIIPQEYAEAPIHYAVGNYFSAAGNEARFMYHLGTEERPGKYYSMIKSLGAEYSSSNQSTVVTGEDYGSNMNIWLAPPPAA